MKSKTKADREKMWKAYKPIICKKNHRLRLIKNSSNGRTCSYCGEVINPNEGILTIEYHAWFHLGCVDEFCEVVSEFKKENAKELILDSL